jgi:shikimate kinase
VTGGDRRVLLVGMMGVGKTTVGRALARRHGWTYLDSDEEVQRRTGHTVPELFAAHGESGFRSHEAAALADAVSRPGPLVVSVAGGAVLEPANRELLKDGGLVVWLKASPTVITKRVGDGRTRPLLGADPGAAVERLLPVREPLYREVADAEIEVDGVPVEAICDRIDALLDAGGART